MRLVVWLPITQEEETTPSEKDGQNSGQPSHTRSPYMKQEKVGRSSER